MNATVKGQNGTYKGAEIAKSLNDIGFKTKLVIGPNSLDIKIRTILK